MSGVAAPLADDRRLLWTPAGHQIEASNLARFAQGAPGRLRGDRSAGLARALHAWSVDEPAAFWSEVWDFCRVRASVPAEAVVDDPSRMPGARWFEGARLSFAENLLADRAPAERRDEAIVAWNEQGRHATLGWDELRQDTARLAAALRRAGVHEGDRVAAILPNIPEAVVGMLAASSLGAVWSSSSPDFGIDGVMDRFGQIEPRVLICARGALWNGSWHDSLARVRAIARRLPTVTEVVVVDYGREAGGTTDGIDHAVAWDDFLGGDEPEPLEFAQLPFDHPLYVLYSSGTTGMPKCIVHGQGGTLIQHLKELTLHADVKAGEAVFYYTTCGWMMWNWIVSSLALDATLVLYDGSPFESTPGRMWDLVDAERIALFGTSAKYLAMAEKRGLEPRASHDLSSLRAILSTGSVLLPASYDWVYGSVKSDVHLASISGGTDLVSCLVLGDPTAPVHRGEIQAAGLGMRIEVWDEQARPLPVGEKGELVCTQAFPSMPVAFWDDADGAEYRAAYFEHTARTAWRHGDWIERTEHGGFVIHGRSDATLNPGGVRIGTAEIYRQVERLDEIVESVVVGQQWEGDERVVLFVVLRDGVALDEPLETRIEAALREHGSPRHVPEVIVAVPDIPRTISGKTSEIAVRRAIHGLAVENVDALANPESLDHFRDLAELKS